MGRSDVVVGVVIHECSRQDQSRRKDSFTGSSQRRRRGRLTYELLVILTSAILLEAVHKQVCGSWQNKVGG